MLTLLSKSKLIALVFFILLFFWWLRLQFIGLEENTEVYFFGLIYPILALYGFTVGISVAKKWGGWSSSTGKSIYLFSFGLFSLWFGQTAWSFYNIILRVPVPYPSIADLGYVAIIPLYAMASIYLGKTAGAKYNWKKNEGKMTVALVSFVILLIAYFVFWKSIEFNPDDIIKSFLDFMYSFGEVFAITITINVLLLSHSVLGGKMRKKLLFIIGALAFQYITDFTFLYQVSNSTYLNGGIVDFMYATSFLIMTISLIELQEIKI